MNARLWLLVATVLIMATACFGQGGVDPYTNVTLTYRVTPANGSCLDPAPRLPLPDGTPIYVYLDLNMNGPDLADPLATLCSEPPECPNGPTLSWNINQFALNGAAINGRPGTFYCENYISILGSNLTPNQMYLRVYYPLKELWTTRYTSTIFQTGIDGSQIEAEISDWTCQDTCRSIPCGECSDPDSLFMPNPVEPLGNLPVCAMFCCYSSPIIRLYIGPFPVACVEVNHDALVLLNITPGCEGSSELGVSAYYDPPDRGQWVMRGGQPYIQVNLYPQFFPGQIRGCATIAPDYSLGSLGDADCWLPVEMGNVAVTPRDAAVDIQWTTRSESGLARFEILRDQTPIAAQPAVNTPTGAAYQYTDRGVDNGHVYAYELEVVNTDGSRRMVYTVENIVPSADQAVVTEVCAAHKLPESVQSRDDHHL